MITVVQDPAEKQKIARMILEALPDWFGISEARETYIRERAGQLMVASWAGDEPNGFLCLKQTGRDTVELAVMGVLREHHRRGIGSSLFETARSKAAEKGYSFIQVKTVQSGRYAEYDATNLFYQSLGFREFEVMPTLWDEWNPCQIYVMALDPALAGDS